MLSSVCRLFGLRAPKSTASTPSTVRVRRAFGFHHPRREIAMRTCVQNTSLGSRKAPRDLDTRTAPIAVPVYTLGELHES